MKPTPPSTWLLLAGAIAIATALPVLGMDVAGGISPDKLLPEPSSPEPEVSPPKITVTGINIVDPTTFDAITPTAATPFDVEVFWSYANTVCSNYTILRVVNGWTNIGPEINYGCDVKGTSDWQSPGGVWIMYKPGTYTITVTVDSGNAITPSSQTSKTFTTNVVFGGSILPQWALVDVEFGRTNLGPGTDVIVGTMDDAFDYLDPLFTGNDSLGRPRLIDAVQNSLGIDGSPTNDAHSTGVMGIVLARGRNNGDITGFAPDARYISAEFLNREGVPAIIEPDIMDALSVVLTNGAEVINMPWSEWEGSTTLSETGEIPITALMADYLMYASNIFCVAYDNELTNPTIPTAPGSSRNVITVGGMNQALTEVWSSDDSGPTLDGRCKPDILGGQATNCIAPDWDWRAGFPAGIGFDGNSFAGPFVTGAVVQMICYAKHHAQNRDHRVLKAILMNSGVPALNVNGTPWTNSPTFPMDNQQGTGVLNMRRAYLMYSAGQQNGGAVAVPGYDFATVYNDTSAGSTNGVVSYFLGSPATNIADLDVTLAWDRHTYWSDLNEDGQIDDGDTFYVDTNTDAQSILQLQLFRGGVLVAQSISMIDTIQHLHLTNLTAGAYQLNVERLHLATAGSSEPYGLAWISSVPWTNVPPKLGSITAAIAAGNMVNIQFQVTSGQAGTIVLESTSSLNPPIKWAPAENASLSQTGANTYQFQAPINPGPPQFFRVSAQ